MGIPVLILGESGSGKSASLRNLDPGKVGVFNVAGKPMPFRAKLPVVNNATYDSIYKSLAKGKLNTYVIDDSQYLMAFEFFDRAKETGFNKFTDIGLNFKNLIQFVITKTAPDCIVYFLHHVETSAENKLKAKTIGKMLDEKLTLEGLFSIVLLCEASADGHHFITQSDGYTTAKSPMGLFDRVIDNDLCFVDKAIREYWELGSE